MQNFPFEYGKVHLYDELKFRAYRQKLLALQQPGSPDDNTVKAFELSQQIQTILNSAEIKRRALFTESSVYDHFGVIAQIYNSGFAGRILAFFLINKITSMILFILLIILLIIEIIS
ncbi:MAG: hypothetical protein ABIR66_05220 [Saprospiraceae bacterium]